MEIKDKVELIKDAKLVVRKYNASNGILQELVHENIIKINVVMKLVHII